MTDNAAATPATMLSVACPGCGAAYQVPVAKVGPKGRKLKCASCGNMWLVPPAPAADAPEAPAAEPAPAEAETVTRAPVTAPTPVPDPEAKAEEGEAVALPPSLEILARPAWHGYVFGEQKWLTLAFMLVGVGIVGGIVSVMRQLDYASPSDLTHAVHEAPMVAQSARVIPAPLGVVLHSVAGQAEPSATVSGSVLLLITGMVANTGADTVRLPKLRATLVDEADEPQDFWPVPLAEELLPAQSEMPFAVSFTNPMGTGWKLEWVERPAAEPAAAAPAAAKSLADTLEQSGSHAGERTSHDSSPELGH